MATENNLYSIPGLVAGGTINRFTWVKLSADYTVVACTAITDDAIGIAQDNYVSGQAVTALCLGESKMLCGGSISAGNMVGPNTDASGVSIAGGATTTYPKGRALEAGVTGRIISVHLMPGGRTA